ncbi:MAG: AAA family ATPase, partial [Kiritimatiellia bacterium]
MEKAATDIYSFRELREYGFTYVDKTAFLMPLIDRSIGKQFFLARPRRFGKSLLVSTLHCLFEGHR